ncbi:MAG TPA: aldolase/citrate lyase family protein [Gaiellales bacterium]|nr:aldolase/citrate lyase family protein [Gaiellales bacterium]
MTENAITRAIAERGTAVGCMLFEFDTPRVMRLIAAAGVDFALFDLEHTAWDAGSLRRALAAGRATGIHTVTRVVRAQYPLVATALDAGSRGVMAPMVESADEALLLAESSRYPPLGKRGFGVIMSDELDGGPAAAAERANRDTFVIAQIESAAGIEHADEILAVPGIDAAWLGQFDLSLSLGCPGEFEHPRYVEAVDRLLEACRRRGIPLGQLVASAEAGAAAAAQGFQLLAFADVWVFEGALREGVAALRRASPGG